ncbi:MAG TPA: alpha-2-macroglobulin family protein [Flavobacteriales bacterium]|nr:alpha-2-macroglobulin family protein [Flavobacteriales bacterium]
MNGELWPDARPIQRLGQYLMRHARKILFGTAAALVVMLGCASTQKAVNRPHGKSDPRWAAVDSLSNIGQFASALKATEVILAEARAAHDWRTEFRAWMYSARFMRFTGGDAVQVLAKLDSARNNAETPLKQLLLSVAADQWWGYYQQNRWKVLDRTNMDEATDDPETWDQVAFMQKVIDQYIASLEPAEDLAKIPVGELGALLEPAHADTALRPTLFDVLARRALEVFQNSETRLAEPAWRFKLDGPNAFASAPEFASASFATRDSTAWEWQALRLYQRLTALHLKDGRQAALTDVTLDRLAFARANSTLPDKDSLYLKALQAQSTTLLAGEEKSAVMLAIAQWHADQTANYQRLAPDSAFKWERKTAVDICREIASHQQEPFASKRAKALIAQWTQPSLQVNAEEAATPNMPFRVSVSYTNTSHLWLRIVKDDAKRDERRGYRDQEDLKRILGLPVLREWNMELPDDGDLNGHLVDVPVEPLSIGSYSIIASDRSLPNDNGIIVITEVQVTRLSLAQRSTAKGKPAVLVMDRESGTPVEGAKAELFSQFYQNGGLRDISIGSAITGAEGMAEVAAPNDRPGQQRWVVTLGKDRLATPGSYYYRYYDRGNVRDTLRTFLFTDRAIYRPGQPVMFKGIVSVKRGKTTVVKPGYRTTVRFFDVNGQLIDSAAVTTDAFGACHGRFTAPQGTLTGSMRIQEEFGSRYIQVEEYKRPMFEVLFPKSDTAKAVNVAKLNGTATVHGLAKSYAGVPLDGAQVHWTVRREARMPWWCGRYWRSFIPWERSTEIASGTAEADANGNFSISFLAEADAAISRKADPTFTFSVEANITDVNGETQSSSTSISVGYRSIDIALNVGDGFDRSTMDSLVVSVQDLNGNMLDVPMDVRITRLRTPLTPLRDRLWEQPDRHMLTAEQFKERFPQDEHADENDPLTWPKEAVVMERKEWLANGKPMVLSGIADWDVGSYLIEVSAVDAQGDAVRVQKAVTVYDPAVQHTGFVNEAFHVEAVKAKAEPDEKAVLLVSSALSEAHILMEVEREGVIAVRRWLTIKDGQQRVELPVLEADRGGFAVHFISVERGRSHNQDVYINVPWSNKELHVEWMTFRDKLLPGAKEEWRLKITGPKGEKVAAQLLAGMYDASLDHFVPHAWDLSVWPTNSARMGWEQPMPFGVSNGDQLWRNLQLPADTIHIYPELNTYGANLWQGSYGYRNRTASRSAGVISLMDKNEETVTGAMAKSTEAQTVQLEEPLIAKDEGTSSPPPPVADAPPPATRTDFRETAFFLPDLLTDKDGSVILRFTMPDALTRWKLMGLTHTTDLKTAQFTKEVITQKPLMVTPNLPRFLREGDAITLTSKVAVIEGAAVTGIATLDLFDPFTNAALNDRFGLKNNTVPFTAGPGASAAVAWDVQVPEGVSAVSVRISAKAGSFTDGEEKPLPILTDRVLVTESLPLPISKAGTKTFTLEKLKNSTSSTLRNQSLKLEFTPNPAWYAVQALPYLMEYPHACSEQVFSRFYANSLASHIVDERPAIKQVFVQWAAKGEGNEEAFLSKLEKNSELKNVVLAETPWVLNARSERESKQRIALLFDMQRMANEKAVALKKLRDAQLSNGAWPWFTGMQPSRWVTQGIVSGFGHLEKLGAADLRPDGQTQVMLKNAVQWLDRDVDSDYKRLLMRSTKAERMEYTPDHSVVQYLYARSFFSRWPITGTTNTAVEFYKGRLAVTWLSFGLQEQAMIALAMDRLGDHATAQLIMKSLGERATRSEELGMYWKNFNAGWYWWDFPTETHALMIEAFHEVAKDEARVNELRLYLLKLKQTTDWKTTKATAEACYALLLTGDNWLEPVDAPVITVGGQKIIAEKQEAGTGYFQKMWAADAIKPDMGDVTITTTADRAAWGALYWQYFEQMEKVTSAESPFSVKKQVMLNEPTDAGPKLIALDKARTLKPGDKLTVRIELRTDRAMDYVHLKDLRAAGLEPTETLSGYRYQGGLGYYQSTRDAATDFFFDHLRPGTYVFEYDLRVSHAGDFSNGITTAMCMYAPEFSSHSEGVRIEVGK